MQWASLWWRGKMLGFQPTTETFCKNIINNWMLIWEYISAMFAFVCTEIIAGCSQPLLGMFLGSMTQLNEFLEIFTFISIPNFSISAKLHERVSTSERWTLIIGLVFQCIIKSSHFVNVLWWLGYLYFIQSVWNNETYEIFSKLYSVEHSGHMPCKSQSSRFNHPEYIRCTVPTMKFLIVELSTPLGLKYLAQNPVFKLSLACIPPSM